MPLDADFLLYVEPTPKVLEALLRIACSKIFTGVSTK